MLGYSMLMAMPCEGYPLAIHFGGNYLGGREAVDLGLGK